MDKQISKDISHNKWIMNEYMNKFALKQVNKC